MFNYVQKQFQDNMICSTMLNKTTLKPALHIVVTVAEHASDDASKRILKPSTHRLKIFLVKYLNY